MIMWTKYIKDLLPVSFKKHLKKYLKPFFPKIPVHLKNVLGFDIYQNTSDIINYKKFINKSIEDVNESLDGRVFTTMKKFVKEGSVAIDAGANIGLMSLILSKLVGNKGKVFSFEPGPVSFGLLRRNVYSNGIKSNIILSDNALSDSIGKFELFINPNAESDNQLHKDIDEYLFKNEPLREKFTVNTQTIDNFLEKNQIDFNQVSFVKIDTQGHDLSVLRGGIKLFTTTNKIAVLIEFAPYLKAWEKQTIDQFYSELLSYGFSIYDDSKIEYGQVDLEYLKTNYGKHRVGYYTDLLLLKGQDV